MSALNRTCLRLAAVAALRGQTMAEERILDSGIGTVSALRPEERKAIISVYTEEDGGDALSEQNGGETKDHVELVFDISMVEMLTTLDGTIVLGQPQTDAELEANLDLVEAQIHVTLFENVTLPLSVAFRLSFLRVGQRHSLRFRDEKAEERLAHRYLIYRVQVQDEIIFTSYDTTLTGLALLPATFAKVAALWPDDLPEKAIALALAAKFARPATAPLKGIDSNVAASGMANAPGGTTAVAKDGNVGTGTIDLAIPALLNDAQTGTYKIIFGAATTFSVADPNGDAFASGRTETAFANQIAFTILTGATDFVSGDEFDVVVASVPVSLTLRLDLPT